MPDSEDSDLGDDFSDEEDAQITERRDEAIAELKALKSEPSQATIDKFWDDYADVVALKSDNTTFFHEIVQEVGKRQKQNGVDAASIRPLFMVLVKKLPKLLEETDNNGETPLYSAINYRKPKTWRLVKYTLQCCDNNECVKKHVINSLKHLGGRGGQACLNLAFEHEVSDSVLRSLVSIANAEVLELVDSSKKTPFLHAVQYEQCDENRVKLIRLLLDKDMEIIDRHRTRDNPRPRVTTFLDLKYSKGGSAEYSVYGEHERTRRIHLGNVKFGKDQEPTTRTVRNELQNPKAKDLNPDSKVNESSKSMSTHSKKLKDQTTGDQDSGSRPIVQDREQLKVALTSATDEKQRFRQEKRREHRQDKATEQDVSRVEVLRGRPEVVDEATGNQSGAQASSDIKSNRAANTSLKRTNTSNPTTHGPKTTEKKPSPSVKAKAEPGVLAENSEKIREMLKLHYMRTRDVDRATSFLYGKNVQDVHICFEYVGPRAIKDHEFITRFGRDPDSGLKFDEVLSHVKFPPVTVERTDDGVYSFDPAFSNRVIEGKTFDYHDGWIGHHYDSARGHGTEMAKLICKVCPMAEIYSIRLKTETGQDGQPTIDATSAGLAIDAALEKNASIISMSWTIPKPVEASKKRFLDGILRKACQRNVLLFCSPPDSVTKNTEGQYPWAYEPESIFLIGAAHSDGTPYNRAGKKVNFIFPGVNVNLGNGSNQRSRLTKGTTLNKEATGSSIATALAAGLAALIMCCFKTSAIHLIAESIQQDKSYSSSSARVSPDHVEKMSRHETMEAAFTRIGNTGTNKFVQVWKMLPPGNAFFDEDSTEDEKMRCVIDFCTSIYSHT
ncbi:Major intracellular serine protease [Colletotrichum fructicola]|nr:Major intracellular serine protease [Colletotrichum fructicola]